MMNIVLSVVFDVGLGAVLLSYIKPMQSDYKYKRFTFTYTETNTFIEGALRMQSRVALCNNHI